MLSCVFELCSYLVHTRTAVDVCTLEKGTQTAPSLQNLWPEELWTRQPDEFDYPQ